MADVTALTAQSRTLAPGILASFAVAAAAIALEATLGAPTMLMALIIGMAFAGAAARPELAPGINFSGKMILRAGIVLLGARITVGDMIALGPGVLFGVCALVAFTIGFGGALTRFLGRGWGFGILTGGATAICGASAALAISSVLPPQKDMERATIFTILAVTTLSTIAMIAYPFLFQALGFSDTEAGVLVGATIHDVAQVVGAGYAISTEAGDTATIVKLIRVTLLPVVLIAIIMILSVIAARADGAKGFAAVKFPLFVIGFIAFAAANSLGLLPGPLAAAIVEVSRWFLVMAVAAIGLKTSVRDLASYGIADPLIVVAHTLVLLIAALLISPLLMP
jgi:uncharacterized integral membrane protein (TIGR00698 family)